MSTEYIYTAAHSKPIRKVTVTSTPKASMYEKECKYIDDMEYIIEDY